MAIKDAARGAWCFSPVAGIQWVETLVPLPFWLTIALSFSPVAGIQWVETPH